MIGRSKRSLRTVAAIVAVVALIGSGIAIDRVLLGSRVTTASPGGSVAGMEEPGDGHSSEENGEAHSLSDEPGDGVEALEGSEHTEGGEPAVMVELSPRALTAIGLTTEVVRLRPTERTLDFPGVVRMHPDGVASVSTRIQGKVLSAAVAPGDRVERGQVLARIQSLVPGNPPPTVNVVAPITGIVMSRDAVVGEAVQPSKELFRLIDPRQVVAEALVPERIVDRIRPGDNARVHLLRAHEDWSRAHDHDEWRGRVTFVGSEADPESRTYPVWISLLGTRDAPPRSGRFVQVRVIESVKTALAVPQAAIVEEGPLRFVFVKRGGAFERRLVSAGPEGSQNVEILSGLAPGDTVAVTGSYELMLALETAGGSGPTGEAAPHEH